VARPTSPPRLPAYNADMPERASVLARTGHSSQSTDALCLAGHGYGALLQLKRRPVDRSGMVVRTRVYC
jgi:hypothetical protein